METIQLHAQTRTLTGKKLPELRAQKLVPAVLYGHKIQNQLLSVPTVAFDKVYEQAGESALVDLAIEGGATVKVLIHDVKRHPVKNMVEHVDFYQVNMTEKLHTEIPLEFIGEPKAAKELGGILVKSIEAVEVKCLPSDLVHEIQVDVTNLATFDDVIHIKDLVLPKGIEIMNEEDEVVASIAEPASEEELAALEEKPEADVSSIEVEKKGKEEEAAE